MFKMQQLFSVLLCLGGLLLLTQCAAADVTYYVVPEAVECPEGLEPCYNIDYYITNRTYSFSSDKSNITMNFLAGTHKTVSEGDLKVFGLNRLSMIGMSPKVVINGRYLNLPHGLSKQKTFTQKTLLLSESL